MYSITTSRVQLLQQGGKLVLREKYTNMNHDVNIPYFDNSMFLAIKKKITSIANSTRGYAILAAVGLTYSLQWKR